MGDRWTSRKKAREQAILRVYEITSTTISAVTMLEIMDDARQGRTSVVWFNEGKTFTPIGLGARDKFKKNEGLHLKIGDMAYHHLLAYINAGNQLRNELSLMLADCPTTIFVDSFDELKVTVTWYCVNYSPSRSNFQTWQVLPRGYDTMVKGKDDKHISAFTKHNLNEQGFGNLDDATKSRYMWSLRFTPGVSISLVAIGLVWQSPIYLGILALIGLSGALLPEGMLIDLIYNFGVRHLFHAPPLPPTPKPRQFSYLISTLFLTGSALSFYYGLPVLGIILGGLVCIAGAVLTTSLWCLGSWLYKLIFGQTAAAG